MFAAARSRLGTWLFQHRGPESGAIVLSRRRVFILPSRQGFMFAAVLLMMLIGSINYGLSLGFVLTFMLVALAFNGMLYTFRNLAWLSLTTGRTPPVFAGESALFTLMVTNQTDLPRHAIGISRERLASDAGGYADVPAHGSAELTIAIPAERRGRLQPGRLTIYTRYPLGLYYAWSYAHTDAACVVYPRPAAPGVPLPGGLKAAGNGLAQGLGQDDFAGLRAYRPGDPPRHIAWKTAARGQGLYTKQFSGHAAHEVWLDWQQLPPHMDVEEKLSRLTRWVLDAHAQQLAYGLRLPDKEIALGSGEVHRQRCLEALALFDLPQSASS